MAMIIGDITCSDGLSAAIYDAIVASASGADLDAKQKAFAFAIAYAVVSEITARATVNPTGLLAPPGTAGGPVTGTGTIT